VARWQVGVGVARKHRVHSLEALIGARLPVAQRESAAASQQAFERALAGLGRSAPPPGALASGHLDAARTASIVEGAAVTTEAAAGAFGLEFLPLEDHVVELWTAETWTGQAGVTALLELLCSRAFTERVVHFGGYDLDGCGEPAGVT
jgi:molybdate-binding protein